MHQKRTAMFFVYLQLSKLRNLTNLAIDCRKNLSLIGATQKSWLAEVACAILALLKVRLQRLYPVIVTLTPPLPYQM